MYCAMALAATRSTERAEKEFTLTRSSYSNYEARYLYGIFSQKAGRSEDTHQVFIEMLDQAAHLSRRERRPNQIWFK